MNTPLKSYVRQGKKLLCGWMLDPTIHLYLRCAAHLVAGFGFSAASLCHVPLPLTMGLVCACTGWSALLVAVGGSLGYLVFWGSAGHQGIAWLAVGLLSVVFRRDRRLSVQMPFLQPALSGLIVSATGVVFQTWLSEDTQVGVYLLRVCLAAAATWVFSTTLERRNPVTDWLCSAFGVLALAQMTPLPLCNLGFVAAGLLAVAGALPAAALAGLALDLSVVTPVSITGVLCAAFFLRFLPGRPKWLFAAAPAVVYLTVMVLTGNADLFPLPGLLLGGMAGVLLPLPSRIPNRRGETGIAQVRLELAAGVLAKAEQLLQDVPERPIDEEALVARAAEQACSGCPCRKGCKDSRKLEQLPVGILYKPLVSAEELPVMCRKSGRFLAQLHHSQERLRSIRADRERQQEYRSAVTQQYSFLSEYLQDLSDTLARRTQNLVAFYGARVQIFGNRPEPDNGDLCLSFAGPACKHFVVLCDGMGTGPGAVQEARTAAGILKKLLYAGFPAEHALETLNSLCALRSRAGAVTVELLELQLDSGKGLLYKWGAAASYLLRTGMVEKIGTAGPPPGLGVSDQRETVHRLSLRRGETLVLVSDGVGEEDALYGCLEEQQRTPEGMAEALLQCGQAGEEDDATVVMVQLVLTEGEA